MRPRETVTYRVGDLLMFVESIDYVDLVVEVSSGGYRLRRLAGFDACHGNTWLESHELSFDVPDRRKIQAVR